MPMTPMRLASQVFANKSPMKKHKGLPDYRDRAAYSKAWRKLTGKDPHKARKEKRARRVESEIGVESGLAKYAAWLSFDDCGGMKERCGIA